MSKSFNNNEKINPLNNNSGSNQNNSNSNNLKGKNEADALILA